MTKLSFTRSLILGALATTALTLAAAQAKDPSLSFHPAEKWNVSSTDKGCMVSSEFNNGYVIELAGTNDGFTNLNIDFRQDTFEQGKTYTTKLSVPGGAEASVSAKAFETNMIVSDLRPHAKLSQALIKASVLDLEIEGNAFRFYMTGLGAAMKDYQQCSGKRPEPVASSDDNDVTPLPLADRTADGDAQIEEIFQGKTDDIPPTQERRKKPENRHNKNNNVATDEPTSLQQKMAELAARDSGEKPPVKTIDTAKEEKIKDKEETKLEPKAVEKLAEPVPLKQPPAVHSYKTPDPKITRQPTIKMEADFSKVEAPKKPLPPIDESRDIKPNAAVSPDFADMRAKVKDLESQVLRLQKENKNLDDDLKQALNDSREERLSVSSDNWNLERATMKFNESERQIERLGRQLQTQKTQCDMEKRELEGMLFDPKVTDQQQLAKLSALEADLEQTKADLLMQKRSYEERIKLLEEQLKR